MRPTTGRYLLHECMIRVLGADWMPEFPYLTHPSIPCCHLRLQSRTPSLELLAFPIDPSVQLHRKCDK